MKKSFRSIVAFIALSVLMAFIVTIPQGCAGTVNQLWVQQNQDFQRSVVDGVLMPHYMADPAVPQASKDNVAAANDEHKALLRKMEAGDTTVPIP